MDAVTAIYSPVIALEKTLPVEICEQLKPWETSLWSPSDLQDVIYFTPPEV